MNSQKLFSICIVASTVGLASCGGAGGALSRPTAASGTITSAQASSFYTGNSSKIASYGLGMTDGTSGTGVISAGLGSKTACTPTVSGSETDADSDGIPVSVTKSYSCTAEFGSASGSVVMLDKDDTTKFGGFKVDLVGISYVADGFTLGADATVEGTKNADGSHTGKADMVFTVVFNNVTAKAGYFMDFTAVPTSATDPTAAGTISTASGFISVTESSGSQTQSVTLALAGTNLVYDKSSCGVNAYKSGTITITDGAGNVLAITYTNCAKTGTFNGTAL